MSVFRTWLFGIVAAAMVLSILYALLPKGALLTIAKCTGGLVLRRGVLRPLLTLDMDSLRWQYEAWEGAIQQQTEAYTDANRQEMAAIIQQETAAYISEKAAALGLTCHPEVVCQERDGVPFPVEVTLDIPRNPALAEVLGTDLGIGEDCQHWQETE